MLSANAFDYHEDYYSINTGAHRKGGLELDAPTLTHHLGLWFPRQPTPAHPERSVARHGRLVDEYVAAHFAALRDLDGFECNFEFDVDGSEVICLFGGAYRADEPRSLDRFEITAEPAHFVLKDAIESETRILFMKARWQALVVIVRCEFHSEYFTITRVVTVADLDTIPDKTGPLASALRSLAKVPGHTMTTDACYAYLYRGVWETLDRALFVCEGLFGAGDAGLRGRVFADFRGLVMMGDDSPEGVGLSLMRIGTVANARRPFHDDWPVGKLLPSLWPFLTVEKGLDLKRREFTASFMLRKRAVYVTALGPQPPADAGFVCAPLNYLLVARPISDWQLGSLVDRLHFMGTVRLAALMELPALRRAGANLRATEHEAGRARSAVDDDRLDNAVHHYQRAQDLIAHTDRKRKPIFWEGLQFRVERSRYYVKRFDDFVHFLEMSAIDGFQQYDHFVRARLGANYDYIDRLGRRQERAVQGLAGIWQSISLKEDARTSRTIEKLQTKAEIALLAVIVPHYLMDMFKELDERMRAPDHSLLRADVAIWLIGLSFAMMSLATYVVTRRDYGFGQEDRRSVQKYLFLTLLSAVIITWAWRS